jgi:hypothetical protein
LMVININRNSVTRSKFPISSVDKEIPIIFV